MALVDVKHSRPASGRRGADRDLGLQQLLEDLHQREHDEQPAGLLGLLVAGVGADDVPEAAGEPGEQRRRLADRRPRLLHDALGQFEQHGEPGAQVAGEGGRVLGRWDRRGGGLIVSILGATGILTRLLGGTNEQALLVALGVACVVLMLALAFVRGRAATSATILLAGLACGPVFPTMMAVVLLSVQPDTMGRAVGFFFFFASVGWTVVPMIIGVVARKTNIQIGFLVAAASGAVFLTLIVIKRNDDRVTLGPTAACLSASSRLIHSAS